jgi:hypothetical protein
VTDDKNRAKERRKSAMLVLTSARTISATLAERGYEGAASTDHDRQAQAVRLFLSDVLLQI